MKWWHVLGVLAGVVSGFVLTLVLGIGMAIVLLVYYTSQGETLQQAAKHMDAAHVATALPLLIGSLGAGAFALLLGGLLAAWIGGTGHVLTGLATGIVSTVLSIPFFFWYPYPAWYDIACVVVTIAPAAMGGYLARVFANVRRTPLPAAL